MKYNNTYLTAQENKRPNEYKRASESVTVVRVMEQQPSKSHLTSSLHRERAEGEVAYGSTAVWLESIRSQIDGFHAGGSSKLSEKNGTKYQTIDTGVYDL